MDNKKYSLQDFRLLSVFAYGNYSKVALVRKKDDGKVYAMKVIKKQIKGKSIKKSHALIEKQVLTKSHHPFIVKLHATFQDSKRLFFILDYCPGGQLFTMINKIRRISQEKYEIYYSSCRFYAAQIFLALDYLHSIKIIYRDLKPENIIFDYNGYLKLVDFGLCIYYKGNSMMSNQDLAGTVYFLPPQAFQKDEELGYQSDWWSFGSLVFEMTVGFPPFFNHKDDTAKTITKIKTAEPPLQLINSQPLRNFLKLLLEKNPKKRLGYKRSDEIKNHPWLSGINWQKILLREQKASFIPVLTTDEDISFFVEEPKIVQLTPPEQDNTIGEYYKSFSLSWKSSTQKGSGVVKQSSPIEICLNIEDSQQLMIHVSEENTSTNNINC